MYDCDYVFFDIVCEQPETYDIGFTQFCYWRHWWHTWRLDRLTDGCTFYHRYAQELTYAVHQSKRFLQLNAPKHCDVDKLIFGEFISVLCRSDSSYTSRQHSALSQLSIIFQNKSDGRDPGRWHLRQSTWLELRGSSLHALRSWPPLWFLQSSSR